MRLAFVIPFALLAACGEDLPTTAELHGDWVNEDSGTTREFVFAAEGGAETYVLYSFPTGQTPVEVQTGTYYVEAGVLVTAVATGTGAGEMYGNDILDWTGTTLTLESDSSSTGERVYTKQ